MKSSIKNGIFRCKYGCNKIKFKHNVCTKLKKEKLNFSCSKFFITTCVNCLIVYSEVFKANDNKENELVLSHEEVKKSLDEGIRLNK